MSDKDRTENSKNENSKEEKLFRAMSGVDEELLLRSEQSGSKNTGKVHRFPVRYATRIGAACLCFVVAGVLYVAVSSTKMADSTGSADTAAPVEQYAAAQAVEDAGNDGRSGENMSGEAMADMPEAAAQAADAGNDGGSGEDTSGTVMADMPEAAAQAAEDAENDGRSGEDTSGTVMAEMTESAEKVPENGMYEAATALPEGDSSEVSNGATKEAASVLPEETAAEAPESAAEDVAPEGATAGSAVEGNVQQAAQAGDGGMQDKQDSQMSAAGADSCCDGGMAETGTEAVAQEVMEKQGRHLPGKMTKKGQ